MCSATTTEKYTSASSGKDKRSFLAFIAKELRRTHEDLHKLPFEEKLACRCETCQKDPEPHFFGAAYIQRCRENNINPLVCEKESLARIDVHKLAEGLPPLHLLEDDKGRIVIHNQVIPNIGGTMSNQTFNGNPQGIFGGTRAR
ncbi:MAG: hypothetical protein R2880_05215 [Deinococcales bacterium]